MNIYKKFLLNTYNVGIVRKPIDDVMKNGLGKGDIVWLKHKYKDRFFADPFMIKEDDNFYYILAEEFIFWEGKGKISLLTVSKKDFALIEKKVVIEEDTHLSFPFCEVNGTTIIPESVQSGKTTEYYFDQEKMSVYDKKVIINEGLIDAAFYEDKEGKKWVLTSKSDKPLENMYLYQMNNGKYVPSNEGNIISSGIEVTRSAGRLFKYKGDIYRPVQDCKERYGKYTRIMKVNLLNSNSYKADCVAIMDGSDNPPYNETLHTFNVYDNCIIVDGSKDFLRFPMKFFYRKCKWMFKSESRK